MTTPRHLPSPSRSKRRCLGLALVWGLLAITAARADGGGCPSTEAADLEPGDQLSEISGQAVCPNGPIFVITVPARATSLSLTTSGGTGTAHLLVKFGAIPTRTSFDFFSGNAGTAQSVVVQNPKPGPWYVEVFPAADFSGITLAADFTAQATKLEDGQSVSGLQDGQADDFMFFSIDLPPGSAALQVSTSGGTGGLFLYVRRQYLPTTKAYDAASFNPNSTVQSVGIPSPGGGGWKIGVLASQGYSGVTISVKVTAGTTCLPGPTNLCLLGGRFLVESGWTIKRSGASGPGSSLPGSDQTGTFWFFDRGNTEVVVKVLDGRAFNGHFWVLYGSITDVEYTIRVTDTQTGIVRNYHHPPGNLSGGADTLAF